MRISLALIVTLVYVANLVPHAHDWPGPVAEQHASTTTASHTHSHDTRSDGNDAHDNHSHGHQETGLPDEPHHHHTLSHHGEPHYSRLQTLRGGVGHDFILVATRDSEPLYGFLPIEWAPDHHSPPPRTDWLTDTAPRAPPLFG